MAMLPVEVIMHRPVKKDSSLERLFLAMILRNTVHSRPIIALVVSWSSLDICVFIQTR